MMTTKAIDDGMMMKFLIKCLTLMIYKSKSLESKFLTLDSVAAQTLDSLTHRENSIPDRETAAVQLINDQKEAALSELQKPAKFDDIPDSLKSLCRRMDTSGLLKFIISKRKESVSLRAEISRAIWESIDPSRLVIDAVEEFLCQKREKEKVTDKVTDKRWACGMLVQAIFPEVSGSNCRRAVVGPQHARSLVERVTGILEKWKEDVGDGEFGPAEAVLFLQMVVGFGLTPRFDQEFLKKLVMDYGSRRDMARLAACLGFGEKMGGLFSSFSSFEVIV